MNPSWFEQLKRYDDRRSSLPGEHWVALGAGLWLLSRHGSATVGRFLAMALGVALIYRAASGRDGLVRLIPGFARTPGSVTPPGRRPLDFDQAMPYSKRVRVPAISQPLDKSTTWTP